MNRLFPSLLLTAVLLSGTAVAQINPFRNTRGTPLNNADIAALTDATNRLLDRHPPVTVGASETWNNPDSGASGTVTAGSSVHRKGMACRVVKYANTMPGPRPQRSATLTWCKTKDGWKIG